MMYGLMIEQWEDERALYVERCDEMQRNDEYGPEWQALNIRIAMIDEFLAFLKRCAAREAEHQEATADDIEILNLHRTEWNMYTCRILERFYGSKHFHWTDRWQVDQHHASRAQGGRLPSHHAHIGLTLKKR